MRIEEMSSLPTAREPGVSESGTPIAAKPRCKTWEAKAFLRDARVGNFDWPYTELYKNRSYQSPRLVGDPQWSYRSPGDGFYDVVNQSA